MSSKLNARAKRALLTEDESTLVSGLVELSPSANSQQITKQFEAIGATIRSCVDYSHVVSIDIPAGRLNELAGLRDVVYVTADEGMSL